VLRHAGVAEIVEGAWEAECGGAIMWPIRIGFVDGALRKHVSVTLLRAFLREQREITTYVWPRRIVTRSNLRKHMRSDIRVC
jgi:hypothetical protein